MKKEIKNSNRLIRLSDILLLCQKKVDLQICMDWSAKQIKLFYLDNKGDLKESLWDLTIDTLAKQSDDTKQFLLDLLCNKQKNIDI